MMSQMSKFLLPPSTFSFLVRARSSHFSQIDIAFAAPDFLFPLLVDALAISAAATAANEFHVS